MTEVSQFCHRIGTQQNVNKYTLINVKLPRSTLLYKHVKTYAHTKADLTQFLGLYRFGLREVPFCMVLVFRIYSLYSNLRHYLPPPTFWCRLWSTEHQFHRVLKVSVSAQLNTGCQSFGSVVTCLEISLLIYGHAEILRGFLQFLRTQARIKSQIRQRPLPVKSINQSLQHAMLNSPSQWRASFNK